MSLYDEMEDHVQECFDKHTPLEVRARKVIHDPIHGSNIFEPHEIALIDTPLFQRLRGISQTDVASLVYPAANHKRLGHSLGVAVVAGNILDTLKKRHPKLITSQVTLEIRIAALLHDIGHGPFSHLSEDIFKNTNKFKELEPIYNQDPGKFDQDKPTEMLAYLILHTEAFKEYFDSEIIKKYGLPNLNLTKIAEMIIGQMTDSYMEGYKADIINGPFDADKLEYLQRDAYLAGFRSGVDIDRFLHTVWVETHTDKPRCMKVMTSGVSTLEQILFNKILFFSRIYHHHKVRAAGCHIKGIFEMLEDNPNYKINDLKMDRVIHFLKVTDKDIINFYDKPPEVEEYIQQFLNRSLFKRALVISSDTIEDPRGSEGYFDLKELADQPEEIRDLRELIVESLGNRYSIYDIWVDIPKSPLTIEPAQAIIQDEGGSPKILKEFFPVEKWLTSYESVKWEGYVFCPPDPKIRKEVGKKVAEVLHDIFNISFKPAAWVQAKIPGLTKPEISLWKL